MNKLKHQLLSDISSLDLRRHKSSKFDPFKDEILFLRQNDMGYQDIADWLKKEKALSASPSSIHYIVHKWKSNHG